MARTRAITVIIPTYKRPETLAHCVRSLMSHLVTLHEVQYFIGYDGGKDDIKHVVGWPDVYFFPGPGHGLGANLNNLIKMANTDIVLQMDDDHILERDMAIDDYVAAIRDDPMIGWVRLMLGERVDSDNLQTYYKFLARLRGRYWILIPDKELYIPSNRPHLKRADFHEFYGYYAENVKLGQVETEFCHRYADKWPEPDLPRVTIPLYLPLEGTWTHIGDSWQKKGF